jgi:segregation and condensation protein B
MTEFSQLKRIVEAALLAAAQPLSLTQISALFGENEAPPHEELARVLEELGNDCADRGVELKEVASGFRYQVREDVHAWVARLWTERQTKYSRALLETLALIAYRQPITRGEIEQIQIADAARHLFPEIFECLGQTGVARAGDELVEEV